MTFWTFLRRNLPLIDIRKYINQFIMLFCGEGMRRILATRNRSGEKFFLGFMAV